MQWKFGAHVALTAALLMMGVATSRADHGGSSSSTATTSTRLRTKLTGAAIATKTPEGEADFRTDSRGRTRLSVEVENVNLPAGTALTVAVVHGAASTNVGTITLSATMENELELNSQNGDLVPAVVKGDMVTVSNGATAILAGVF
jgi:hypothetical protein